MKVVYKEQNEVLWSAFIRKIYAQIFLIRNFPVRLNSYMARLYCIGHTD